MVAVTRYYRAEDQYLETFTELQHYLNISLVYLYQNFLQIMTYGYSHPLSSYSSVTRFQVKAHILRVRGQSVSHAANLTGDVLPQLPLVEPKSMVYYIQLCLALISLSNRHSLLAHRVTNDGPCTPLAVSHKPSYQGAISARKQSLVHRDIKLKLFIAIISPIIRHFAVH